MTTFSNDEEGALGLIAPCFGQATRTRIEHAEIDPDVNRVRDYPRFKSMVAAAARAKLEVADGPQAVRAKDA